MDLSQSYIANLLLKEATDQLSLEESTDLENWKQSSGATDEELNALNSLFNLQQRGREYEEAYRRAEQINSPITLTSPPPVEWSSDRQPRVHRAHFLRRAWFRYAAAVVLLIGATIAIVVSSDRQYKSETDLSKKIIPDVSPGKFKATLTLADGRIVVLDTAIQGELAKQGNTIVFNKDGKLVYDFSKQSPSSSHENLENSFNTLSTANGQTYSMTLSDGSKVWLNSGSSIRYPVVFTGKERRVEVSGEAYFEVSHIRTANGKIQPFVVSDGKVEITVLGTHFNVNSYGDDGRIRVTLLEGSVKVKSIADGLKPEVILRPGQQAVFTTKEFQLSTNNAPNLEAVTAWKEGKFYFEGATINDIMHQLGRWYNLEVGNEPRNSEIRIGGQLSRNKNLSEMLEALELSDVHLRVEGRKLMLVQ
jgi:ferric-dicitrate binding protein FerR (iron transport regulator)